MVTMCLPSSTCIGVEQDRIGGALEMHGAGTARADAAPELGAGEAEFVAEVPEEGHGSVAVEGATLAIDEQLHAESPAGYVVKAPGWKISALHHSGQ